MTALPLDESPAMQAANAAATGNMMSTRTNAAMNLDEWSALTKYQDERVLEEQKRVSERLKQNQQQLRKVLDAQIDERNEIRRRQKEEEERFQQSMQSRMDR